MCFENRKTIETAANADPPQSASSRSSSTGSRLAGFRL
jgi:hypothetical protein